MEKFIELNRDFMSDFNSKSKIVTIETSVFGTLVRLEQKSTGSIIIVAGTPEKFYDLTVIAEEIENFARGY